jgi:thiamine biosynthesis lipoprotein
VKEWGFTTGEYRVVSEDECAELAEHIDYTRVELLGDYTALPEGMQLDLGAVAKGYVGDRMVEALEPYQCHALLNLGQSTIAAIGTNPYGDPWRIGIQDPAGDTYLGVLSLNDQAMGSSGNYQRFFEENGVKYGHIIDPDTAAPVDNDLAGVTVVADSALYCDGLSTALFVMGLEDAADFWREHRDFEAIFIEENGTITITSGLQGSFRLQIEQRDREVRVLE